VLEPAGHEWVVAVAHRRGVAQISPTSRPTETEARARSPEHERTGRSIRLSRLSYGRSVRSSWVTESGPLGKSGLIDLAESLR
jgi:hypothetical protein